MTQVYKTTDQGFATYLEMKGYVCVKAVPAGETDIRRKAFIFIDVPDGEDIYHEYDTNNIRETFDPKQYAVSWRRMSRFAKEALSQEEVDRLKRG